MLGRRVRGETYLGVDGGCAVAVNDQRIHVELGNLRELGRQLSHAEERVDQSRFVGG